MFGHVGKLDGEKTNTHNSKNRISKYWRVLTRGGEGNQTRRTQTYGHQMTDRYPRLHGTQHVLGLTARHSATGQIHPQMVGDQPMEPHTQSDRKKSHHISTGRSRNTVRESSGTSNTMTRQQPVWLGTMVLDRNPRRTRILSLNCNHVPTMQIQWPADDLPTTGPTVDQVTSIHLPS